MKKGVGEGEISDWRWEGHLITVGRKNFFLKIYMYQKAQLFAYHLDCAKQFFYYFAKCDELSLCCKWPLTSFSFSEDFFNVDENCTSETSSILTAKGRGRGVYNLAPPPPFSFFLLPPN